MGGFFIALAEPGATMRWPEPWTRHITDAMAARSSSAVHQQTSDRHALLLAGADCQSYGGSSRRLIVDGALSANVSGSRQLAQSWCEGDGEFPFASCDGHFAACGVVGESGNVLMVRDRYGTRPIVWSGLGGMLLVASEVALLLAAGVKAHVNRMLMPESLRFRWMLGHDHLFAPVRQVPVAHATVVTRPGEARTHRYWRIPFAPRSSHSYGLEHAVRDTQKALRESIETAAEGNKRVAVLLSGGIDSSIIAAAARDVCPGSFAIAPRLPDSANVELERTGIVAAHIGMPCTVVDISRPSRDDAASMVLRLEELPRNPNNVVLRQLYARAAGEADVVLTGDAAEMYFGLADIRVVERFASKRALVQRFSTRTMRGAAASLLTCSHTRVSQRARRLLQLAPCEFAACLDEIRFAPATREYAESAALPAQQSRVLDEHAAAYGNFEDGLHAYEAETFLVSSLVRHDRLAQPFGLTSLTPFLMPAMIDVAARLPRELRYTDGSKPVLRALCDARFPNTVSRWPKMGFESAVGGVDDAIPLRVRSGAPVSPAAARAVCAVGVAYSGRAGPVECVRAGHPCRCVGHRHR